MSAHLPSFSCLLYPTSGHTSTHTHTHWSTAPPTAYCTLCHCPIFQHQCWSMLQKRRRFSFEPLSQLAHHSYCMFATRVRAIESVVLWSCSCHILLWSKNTQTSVTNSPSFIKIILKKKGISWQAITEKIGSWGEESHRIRASTPDSLYMLRIVLYMLVWSCWLTTAYPMCARGIKRRACQKQKQHMLGIEMWLLSLLSNPWVFEEGAFLYTQSTLDMNID